MLTRGHVLLLMPELLLLQIVLLLLLLLLLKVVLLLLLRLRLLLLGWCLGRCMGRRRPALRRHHRFRRARAPCDKGDNSDNFLFKRDLRLRQSFETKD
jgi:hypothetical protein